MAISAGTLMCYNALSDNAPHNQAQAAKSLTDIQAERAENDRKIAEYQQKIDALQESQNSEKEYQDTLTEQITVIQQNIKLLNTELDSIQSDIDTTKKNITQLEKDIDSKEKEINDSVEDFKKRMCAMYISGNDNLASIIIGSSSFYDIMSRVEMANRMAEYDQKLIDDILADIENLDSSKKQLETDKLTLEMNLDTQKKRKEEKNKALDDLDEKMKKTQAEIDRLEKEQETLKLGTKELQKQNEALDAQEAEWVAAIEADRKRREEDAKKKAEEERRRKEEEERRRKEEEMKNQQVTTEASSESSQESSTDSSETSTDENADETTSADTTAEDSTEEETTPEEPEVSEPAPNTGGFIWPCPGFYYISSGYGYRWGRMHNGIDVGDGGIHGGAAVASQSGTVIAVSNSCTHDYPKYSSCCGGGYGNYVLISHDGTYSTLYGHLAQATVSVGDYVNQGDTIGYIGCTGWSTGDHLHFEVRVNGAAQNPLNYVNR